MDKIIQDVAYVAAAIAPIVGAWFAAILHKRYSAEQVDRAMNFAHVAVNAAEQMAKNWPVNVGLDGKTKYQFAESMAIRLADKAGIHLTEAQVQPLIESAVYSAHQFNNSFATGSVVALDPIPTTLVPPPGVDSAAVEAIVEAVLQKHFAPKILGEATN